SAVSSFLGAAAGADGSSFGGGGGVGLGAVLKICGIRGVLSRRPPNSSFKRDGVFALNATDGPSMQRSACVIAHSFSKLAGNLHVTDQNVRSTRVVLRPDFATKKKCRCRGRLKRHDRLIVSSGRIPPTDVIHIGVAILHEHRVEGGEWEIWPGIVKTGYNNPRDAAINACDTQRSATTMTIRMPEA